MKPELAEEIKRLQESNFTLTADLNEILKEWESERKRMAREARKDTHPDSISSVLSGWNQCYGRCIIDLKEVIEK